MTNLELLEHDERLPCPKCGSQDCVKNGIVRATQRYRCRECNSNFSMHFKHRWPDSSKLINLLCYRLGDTKESVSKQCGASPATIDRWHLEAKEHHPWFVRAVAAQVLFAFDRQKDSIEKSLCDGIGMYAFITERDPNRADGEFGDLLIAELAKIASEDFVEAYISFVGDLPVEPEVRLSQISAEKFVRPDQI
ncbi:transposase-like zinc-binding domain-containing protein [Rhizobium aouanii]|uniref:IS1 family transposase n=1 Tax=Rhizobium aouanii TaxID=3118145 RepID=A0ABU8CF79_9HYPH